MTTSPASDSASSTPLSAHPRLLASPRQLRRLRETPRLPLLSRAQKKVEKLSRGFIRSRQLTYNPNLHNSLLVRAREMQVRVITLLVRWFQTGETAYRESVLDHLRDMGAWEHWSWFLQLSKNSDPKCAFDLSSGENSATVALAYDWLYDTLTDEERSLFRRIALKWSFEPFLARTEEGRREWWFGHAQSNWNTVCAGGAGMLALALHEDVPEAAEVLRRAELSIPPYMEGLNATGGGWVEGVGYWNYGHRYAFWYLLSHERSTGREHPLLQQAGTRQTLDFPFDFCPNGQPCSFGDVNNWSPLAFHYAIAERLRRRDVIAQLDARLKPTELTPAEPVCWPNDAELLIFHPRKSPTVPKPKLRVAKRHPNMDWSLLADRMPEPHLYLSLRGGTTEVPHSHLDLLSFHAVAGSERLIDNIGINGGDEYLDSTFSDRRFDLFETRPDSKNTLFINGVGIRRSSSVETIPLKGKAWNGFRLDATAALSLSATEPSGITFCGRLFLMLDGPLAVILDRIVLPQPGRMETRLHTYSRVRFSQDRAEIRGQRERLNLAFASTAPAMLHRAEGALTKPLKRASTMLRWCTQGRVYTEVTFATVLAPGGTAVHAALQSLPQHALLEIHRGGKSWRLQIAHNLRKVTLS